MNQPNAHHHAVNRSDLIALLVLLGLLILTVALSSLHMGGANLAVALAIAGVKAVVIAAVFMELRARNGITRIFALAGFFWLGLLIVLTLADFLTRG